MVDVAEVEVGLVAGRVAPVERGADWGARDFGARVLADSRDSDEQGLAGGVPAECAEPSDQVGPGAAGVGQCAAPAEQTAEKPGGRALPVADFAGPAASGPFEAAAAFAVRAPDFAG